MGAESSQSCHHATSNTGSTVELAIGDTIIVNNNGLVNHTSEARHTQTEELGPVNGSNCHNLIMNTVMEARAPCPNDNVIESKNNWWLHKIGNPDGFTEHTRERQVRDGYKPVVFQKELPTTSAYVYNNHTIGGVPVQLNPSAWMYELEFENDHYLKSYIKDGICSGFGIVDSIENVPPYDSSNYPSVIHGEPKDYVDNLILTELRAGKYLVVENKPHCIHSLGAVKKGDNSYRPITDCSRPEGLSVNNHMNKTHCPFVYNSVDDVTRMMRPGIYSATIDISAAYRAIPIKEEHRQFQGLRWRLSGSLSYLVDTHMCFGARCAPYVFTQIGNFIVRCMNRRGFHGILNYIDDFICFGDSFAQCQEVQMDLINLLLRLGFYISWKKCSSPSQVTKYLGLLFDSQQMRVVLPEEKLAKLHMELEFFKNRTRATRRQLQRLCGILSHCARVVHGGRTFSRWMCNLLKGLCNNQRIRLSTAFKEDLLWWTSFAARFNGTASIIKYNYGEGPWFATDASADGYGIFASGDWVAGYFNQPQEIRPSNFDTLKSDHGHWQNVHLPCSQQNSNINFWELVPVWIAIKRYAPGCKNMHIVAFSDNMQVVHAINKGVSSNSSSMYLLRCIFWECVNYNVYLSARYIPGEFNIIPDLLSRLSKDKYVRALTTFDLCCRGAGSSRN